MSRRIEDLHPDVQIKCRKFLEAAEPLVQKDGLSILITQTYRTPQEQAGLYAQGRTAAGKIVTHSPPGYSWHEFGRAFDIGFLNKKRLLYVGPWVQLGELAESLGLEWGGRWKFRDLPHLEDRGGMTLAQARLAGYTPST